MMSLNYFADGFRKTHCDVAIEDSHLLPVSTMFLFVALAISSSQMICKL